MFIATTDQYNNLQNNLYSGSIFLLLKTRTFSWNTSESFFSNHFYSVCILISGYFE